MYYPLVSIMDYLFILTSSSTNLQFCLTSHLSPVPISPAMLFLLSDLSSVCVYSVLHHHCKNITYYFIIYRLVHTPNVVVGTFTYNLTWELFRVYYYRSGTLHFHILKHISLYIS